MKPFKIITTALCLLPFIGLWAQQSAIAPVIKVDGGKISGVYSDKNPSVAIYKGVPYAAPPVGQLRWKQPQPVKNWKGIRKCNQYGAASLQADRGPVGANKGVGIDYVKEFYQAGDPVRSEDCLYLNVFTTAPATSKKMPVMLWIHGGAYTGGFGHEIEFEGDALAKKGVVLVTINYRLGMLGFLAHPLLTAENGSGSGNYGLYDQLAALKWVKHNIERFGGDPECVTVFGQSAGAGSVQALISSPLSKGYIQRAIIQSGGGLRGIINTITLENAETSGKSIFDHAGISTLEAMRAYPAEKLLGLYYDYMKEQKHFSLLLRPNVDNQLIPKDLTTAANDGDELDIPYMIGYTTDDISPETMYKAATSWSLLLEKQGRKPAYIYHFDYKLPGDNAGAFHSSELWFVFGSLKNCWRPFPPSAYDLSEQIMSYWTNFARTGNPNGPSLPEWKPYTNDSQYIEILKPKN
jgi:para-nitrobenzyl esterase